MNNLQYARVGAVRHKNSNNQGSKLEIPTSSSSDALVAQKALSNNNHLNNISCK
ncbi:hypothetical protein [Maribacter sp.]|uniref:hypothetical protein n=1 Tax=Maribacter sp. TaxID=1897614 RepID=UPI0025BAA621|nr:hypothetical protein [Maribacter sp.]